MLKRNYQDILGGVLFAALGLYVVVMSFSFGIGTARRMDAGYYPMLLGTAAIVLGITIAVSGAREWVEAPRIAWKPFVCVVSGLIAFFLLIDRAGLIPAIWGLIGLSALADEEMTVVSTLTLMLAVSIAAWLLFSVVLGLPLAAIEGIG